MQSAIRRTFSRLPIEATKLIAELVGTDEAILVLSCSCFGIKTALADLSRSVRAALAAWNNYVPNIEGSHQEEFERFQVSTFRYRYGEDDGDQIDF